MKQKSNFEKPISNVISFHKFKESQSETVTSTIAAILAVKIEHPKNISPEDFLSTRLILMII